MPCTSSRTSYTASIPFYLQTMLSAFISPRLLIVSFFQIGDSYNGGFYVVYCMPNGNAKTPGVVHIGDILVRVGEVTSLQQQCWVSNTRSPSNLASIKTITFKLLPTLPAPPACTATRGMSFRYQALPPLLPNYIRHRIRAYPYDLSLHQEGYYLQNINLIPHASIGFTTARCSSSCFLPGTSFQFNYIGC